MLIKATICDHDHPERGLVTVPLPIPKEQYDQYIERVQALGIGNPLKKDCMVMELDSFFSVLKITEGRCVNLDELDYLAKRLDSFDDGEAAQFQAMASKLELFELKDLINLTFCCQQATVITDFSDLEAVGRDHYMNTHAGCVLTEELEALDGTETALLLIKDQEGTVTPYGVVYDNGMELEQFLRRDALSGIPLRAVRAHGGLDLPPGAGGQQEHHLALPPRTQGPAPAFPGPLRYHWIGGHALPDRAERAPRGSGGGAGLPKREPLCPQRTGGGSG